MEISIFAKKRTTREGKAFMTYLSRLHKNDGTELPVSVKFRESCDAPDPAECPMNIIVEKADASLSRKEYTTDEGATGIGYTLWVGAWEVGGEYVDHSLDDFE